MKANLRQQLFVEAWISTNGNGTESARRAGYKGNDQTLAQKASHLLRNAKVEALIAARGQKALAKVHKGTTPEDVIGKLRAQMDGEEPARWKVDDKHYDSQNAAAILGRFLGLEKPKEQGGQVTVNVLAFLGQLDHDTLENIRAAALKALPETVDAA